MLLFLEYFGLLQDFEELDPDERDHRPVLPNRRRLLDETDVLSECRSSVTCALLTETYWEFNSFI